MVSSKSESQALLNQHGNKKVDRTYVARRPLAGTRGYGLDIFMHSGVIIRTNDGMKILLERTEKPHEFSKFPSPSLCGWKISKIDQTYHRVYSDTGS